MLWVTRSQIHVNRTATAWLVRRFVDPGAEFVFVEPAQVARVERERDAVGFDAPGARYPHVDALGRCSFEALVAEHRPDDPALTRLARIVHGADLPDAAPAAESAGLRAISAGFYDVSGDDYATIERASFLYDSLYLTLQRDERRAAR